jgi:ribonucleoside-diphosphate reductase alpha chain
VRQDRHAVHRPRGPHPHDGRPPSRSSPARSARRSTCRTTRRVDDIKDCYRLSWELGLKANALYRDGCKLSQPLNSTAEPTPTSRTTQDADDELEARRSTRSPRRCRGRRAVAAGDGDADGRRDRQDRPPPDAPPPPDTRLVTHKFNVAGHEGYLTVGLYDDGMPGELFITMAKEGSTIGGLMDSLGTATSVALQYGVPLNSMVRKFTHQRFEPAGMTTNRDIPFAKSLVDYIFRWLGMEFIPGYREANAPTTTTRGFLVLTPVSGTLTPHSRRERPAGFSPYVWI